MGDQPNCNLPANLICGVGLEYVELGNYSQGNICCIDRAIDKFVFRMAVWEWEGEGMRKKNYIKPLIIANEKLKGLINRTEKELSSKIEFDDYSIFYQPSDGFVLEYESHNAPLSKCIDIIEKKGFLTLNDYLEERI